MEQSVHGGLVYHITEPTTNARQSALDHLTRAAVIHAKLERLQ